jgi:DUF177 domain-containing protein
MKINVSEIPPQGFNIDKEFPEGSIDSSDIEDGKLQNVRFRGRLSMVNNRLEISGQLNGVWELHCARCLNVFPFTFESPVRIYMRDAASMETEKTRGLEDEDLDESSFVGDMIDLNKLIREQMILHLPMKPICSEQCRGLCPICGQDLNKNECSCEKNVPDPRLAKLKKLLNERGD